jgi:restriction endonuclease S subunit
MVELGTVARLINGRAYKQEELLTEGPTPVLRVGNFFSNRGWYYSDLDLEPDKYCEAGDLLFAWSASFGPRIWDGPRAIYHYHIWKIEPKEAIEKMFLFHLLAADAEKIKSEGNGIAMVHATKGGMEKRKFPLPPLEIQREIVAEIEGYQKVITGARAVLDNYRPHIPINPDWPMGTFSDVISSITPPKKIQTSGFQKTGRWPVIDQSQDEIAGRTDDESALIDGSAGLVIFGDHTCTVKYVAESFAQGADGIKILTPKEGLLPKFVYFYLISFPIVSDGYKRHFSKLKESQIPLPPLVEQQAIVAEIEAEQALVNANRELITRFEAKIQTTLSRIWGE